VHQAGIKLTITITIADQTTWMEVSQGCDENVTLLD